MGKDGSISSLVYGAMTTGPAVVVVVVVAVAVAVWRKRRRRSSPSSFPQCHFCGHPTEVPVYLQKQGWYCTRDDCGQFNGFADDGDYIRHLPELSDPRRNPIRLRPIGGYTELPDTPPVLCPVCSHNQTVLVHQLASFLPRRDFDSEVIGFSRHLEQEYPLCRRCRVRVAERIADVEQKTRRSHLRQSMMEAWSHRRCDVPVKHSRRMVTLWCVLGTIALLLLLEFGDGVMQYVRGSLDWLDWLDETDGTRLALVVIGLLVVWGARRVWGRTSSPPHPQTRTGEGSQGAHLVELWEKWRLE